MRRKYELFDGFARCRIKFDDNFDGCVARNDEFHRLRQAVIDGLMHGVRGNVYEVALLYVQGIFKMLARKKAAFAAHNVDGGLAVDMVVRAGCARRWDGSNRKMNAFSAC